jgi:hypothetical protein
MLYFLMDIERLKYLGDHIDGAAHGAPVDAAVLREALSWLPVSLFAHRQAIMALLRQEPVRRYVELKEAADYLRAPWRAQHFERLYQQAQAELREINAALDDERAHNTHTMAELVSELRGRAQALAP